MWSRLYSLFNGDRVRLSLVHDGQAVQRDWWAAHQTPPVATGKSLQFGDLVRRLPELGDGLILAQWKQSYMAHVSGYQFAHTTGPPTSETMTTTFRHGHHADTKAMILAGEKRSDLLLGWTRTQDALDVVTYTTSANPGQVLFRDMRLDVFGDLFMEFETRRHFGELVVYFATLFILNLPGAAPLARSAARRFPFGRRRSAL